VWFENLGKYRIGANEDALRLWIGTCEEFEHREVAYKLYMAIAVRGNLLRRIWYGYCSTAYRRSGDDSRTGAKSQAITINSARGSERKEMKPAEVTASIAQQKAIGRFIWRTCVRGLARRSVAVLQSGSQRSRRGV